MEQQPNDKRSVGSEAITALVSAGAGAGIGWVLWIATGSIALAIGMAGAIAALANNLLRRVIK